MTTSETSTAPLEPATPTAEDLATTMDQRIAARIAEELGVGIHQVQAAIGLLGEGSTVPFIARYRKEVTGGLDDAQLRTLEERLRYLRELEERRGTILDSISSQGKLTDELAAQILAADSKARLEDIYLPHKPKRRTKAQIAREAGLEPLADALLTDPVQEPAEAAAAYTNDSLDADAALEGARAILVERFGEDADLAGELREKMWGHGRLVSAVREGKQEAGAKFSDYFDWSEPLESLPSHRILAMFRGEKEEMLGLTIEPGEFGYEDAIAARFGVIDQGRPGDRWLLETVSWAWRTRILTRLGIDLRMRLREAAEDEAVRVFGANLRDLLLAAPAGSRPTLGLDPGLRTGVKVAVVDATGKVVATDTIYPHPPRRDWDESLARLGSLVRDHSVELIAIGNGTASRETDKLAGDLVTALAGLDHPLTKVMVSEAGASVYSASAYASSELPDLDVSLRGAVSIARRLQDPLAELVKIEPKSIGVGQYQHDVTPTLLSRALDAVVEDCVNAVGVDVNTASVPLLTKVSGITPSIAENIIARRDAHGAFKSRVALTSVPRLGPKAFEQCAGFLRIRDGANPLDQSSVHPEAYPVVRRILSSTGGDVKTLLGNTKVLRGLTPGDFVDGTFGLPTVTDILTELEKPGRDPRPAFKTAAFAEGVSTMADLSAGLVLEGVVTNVAAFGAFVDIGVHQDGLVHISALSSSYVKDPRDVVKPGDIVKTRVLEVDETRKRISLTMRLEDPAEGGREGRGGSGRGEGRGGREGGGREAGAGAGTGGGGGSGAGAGAGGGTGGGGGAGGGGGRGQGRGRRGSGRGSGDPNRVEGQAGARAEGQPAAKAEGADGDAPSRAQGRDGQGRGQGRDGQGRAQGPDGQGRGRGDGQGRGQGRDGQGRGQSKDGRGGDRGDRGQGRGDRRGQGQDDRRGQKPRRDQKTDGAMADALRRAGLIE